MGYAVTWTEEAMADFMEMWASSGDKAAVTRGARYVESILVREPLHPRHEVVRGSGTAIHAPLGVDFWLDEPNRIVYVTAAWPFSEVE